MNIQVFVYLCEKRIYQFPFTFFSGNETKNCEAGLFIVF